MTANATLTSFSLDYGSYFHLQIITGRVCFNVLCISIRYGIKLLRDGDAEPGDVSSVCKCTLAYAFV